MTEGEIGLGLPAPRRPADSARKHRRYVYLLGFPVLFLVALLSLLLGHTPSGHTPRSGVESVYRSIGIFTGNGSWAFQPDSCVNIVFKLMAIAAPLLTALGLTELITGMVGPVLVRLLFAICRPTWNARRPTVGIFGLDEMSLAFAKTLTRTKAYMPMIFAAERDERLVDDATVHFIPVVDMTTQGRLLPWLERRRGSADDGAIRLPDHVQDVVSFLPSANAQVDLAMRLLPRQDGGKPATPLRVRLLMAERGLAQRLDEHLRFPSGGTRIHPRLVDLDSVAARLLLTTHPFDVLADAFNQKQVHLAIYGFGRLGRAVAQEAARLYVTRASLSGARVRITAIDSDPGTAKAFLAEDPGLCDVLEFQMAPPVRIARNGLTEAEIHQLVPDGVTGHVVTFGDTSAAFALAVSLRRWLLEPPQDVNQDWQDTHRCAPVFIKVADWTGLGRLVRSGVDRVTPAEAEVPGSIFGFGARELLLSPETLLSSAREQGAKAVHAAYDPLDEAKEGTPAKRAGLVVWDELPSPLRDSNFHVYDHLAVKARAIGYRLIERHDGLEPGLWPPADPTMLDDLQRLEHVRYDAERRAAGWRIASHRCDALRLHPDLVAWDSLGPAEAKLDGRQTRALATVAEAAGKRLAEAFVIGIVGHRSGGTPPTDRPIDKKHVSAMLDQSLSKLVREQPRRAPVLLTALATGSDSWAAEVAANLRIPFIVVLPLPYELYREDFAPDELEAFQKLIAKAEYYIELPLRFGRASKMTKGSQGEPLPDPMPRRQQYALAGAYIVERAHRVIGVWDRKPAQGVGGTCEVLSWVDHDVPTEYRTAAIFRPQTKALHTVRISPTPPPPGPGGYPGHKPCNRSASC